MKRGGNMKRDETSHGNADRTASRAKMLMLLAADYIRKNAPGYLVHYDEAEYDGYCLADDLKIEAEQMS